MSSPNFLLLLIIWLSSALLIAGADPALDGRVLADIHNPSFNIVLESTDNKPTTKKLKESESGKAEIFYPLSKDDSSNLVTNQNTDDTVINKKKSSTLTTLLSFFNCSSEFVDCNHLSVYSMGSALSSSIRSLLPFGDPRSTSSGSTMQDKDTGFAADSLISNTLQEKLSDDASIDPRISADPDHERQVVIDADDWMIPRVRSLKSTQSGSLSANNPLLDKTIDESNSKSKSSKSKSSNASIEADL